MPKFASYILFFLINLFVFTAYSQDKKQLKTEKEAIEKEISFTVELLEKTKENKRNSLQYLKVLDSKINNEDKILQIMSIEVNLLKKQIIRTKEKIKFSQNKILRFKNEIEKLKSEYAAMLYSLQKNKANKNSLVFIVSSSTFNQAFKRIIYLKQYSSARRVQVSKINNNQDSLRVLNLKMQSQVESLNINKEKSLALISSKKTKIKIFTQSKNEKNNLIKNLSKSEKLFLSKIKKQEKKAKLLDDKIKEIIKEEIRLAREAAKKINGESEFSLTPEARILSSEFNANKGNLPWPLDQGVIVTRYGKQMHQVFKGVETFNNGINIATNLGSIVRSVFKGVISRIFFIKGEGKAILINHGEYFSVYSGLKEVTVKLGDKVFSKESIGVMTNDKIINEIELHFEIWKGYDKQDPSLWLFKAD